MLPPSSMLYLAVLVLNLDRPSGQVLWRSEGSVLAVADQSIVVLNPAARQKSFAMPLAMHEIPLVLGYGNRCLVRFLGRDDRWRAMEVGGEGVSWVRDIGESFCGVPKIAWSGKWAIVSTVGERRISYPGAGSRREVHQEFASGWRVLCVDANGKTRWNRAEADIGLPLFADSTRVVTAQPVGLRRNWTEGGGAAVGIAVVDPSSGELLHARKIQNPGIDFWWFYGDLEIVAKRVGSQLRLAIEWSDAAVSPKLGVRVAGNRVGKIYAR